MEILSLIFYVSLFVASIVFAAGVIFSPRPVYSAVSLIGVMVSIAGIFLVMSAELLAAIQIVVYAGAIVVLFLFVVQMLNLREPEKLSARNRVVRWIGAAFALAFVLQILVFGGVAIRGSRDAAEQVAGPAIGVESFHALAGRMITDYVLPFELISILLLAAIVGAVAVARPKPAPGDPAFEGLDPEEEELIARSKE